MFKLNNKKLLILETVIFVIAIAGFVVASILLRTRTQLKIGAAGDASLSFQVQGQAGPSYVFPLNQDVLIDVMATTGTSNIESIEAEIDYDPTVLSAKQIIFDPVSLMPTVFSQQIVKDTNGNETGKINITVSTIVVANLPNYTCVAQMQTPFKIATVRFQGVANSASSNLTFSYVPDGRNDSNIVMCVKGTVSVPPGTPTPTEAPAGVDVLGGVTNLTFSVGEATATATPTLPGEPSPTPTEILPSVTPTPTAPPATLTPTPTNSFSRAIYFRLKGVDSTIDQSLIDYRNQAGIAHMTFEIYEKGNLSNRWGPYSTGALYHYQPNNQSMDGTYSVILWNIPDTLKTNAILLVKADKHLRAKFCSLSQTTRCTSGDELNGGIDFTNEDSYYYFFTGYPLLPGDTNQDGVLNGVDVVEMLRELAKTPPTRNNQYDLNYDMVVNGLDYSLMLNSMVVYDDE